jgi:hypothetical protein
MYDETCQDDCLRVTCGNGVIDIIEAGKDTTGYYDEVRLGEPGVSCGSSILACNDRCECVLAEICGDGLRQGAEDCEPEPKDTTGDHESRCFPGESCNIYCECELPCGNGDVDEFEDCDPGEPESSCATGELCDPDFCYCTVPSCNDGFVEGEEACEFDLSDGTPFGDCLNAATPLCHPDTCQCTDAVCGDGAMTADETCEFAVGGEDLGDCSGSTPLCDPVSCSCTDAVCGDGVITGPEGCDVDDQGEALDASPSPCAWIAPARRTAAQLAWA